MGCKIHDEPSKVTAEDGVVMMDGPDGVAVSLTPAAAAETSERLLEASLEARGQAARAEQHVKPQSAATP